MFKRLLSILYFLKGILKPVLGAFEFILVHLDLSLKSFSFHVVFRSVDQSCHLLDRKSVV